MIDHSFVQPHLAPATLRARHLCHEDRLCGRTLAAVCAIAIAALGRLRVLCVLVRFQPRQDPRDAG